MINPMYMWGMVCIAIKINLGVVVAERWTSGRGGPYYLGSTPTKSIWIILTIVEWRKKTQILLRPSIKVIIRRGFKVAYCSKMKYLGKYFLFWHFIFLHTLNLINLPSKRSYALRNCFVNSLECQSIGACVAGHLNLAHELIFLRMWMDFW